MALDHVRNSTAVRERWEGFTANLFRVTLIPPTGVASDPIITENIVSVTGFRIPGPEAITQQFQTARRNLASADVDQTQNISIVWELHLNNNYELYLYKLIQSWRSKVYDPLTGTHGLAKDYMGQAIIENYARDGQIFWTRTLENFWPSGELTGFTDVDYTSPDPQRLETNWIGDYYTESLV